MGEYEEPEEEKDEKPAPRPRPECRHVWRIIERRATEMVACCQFCPKQEIRLIGRRWGDGSKPRKKERGGK